ncbi:pantoate--beta-alanine ligase [uncultured Amnibacterium sp.]|uniref:pantoate--beta-alanine ligase n=1 Tax=uncultured Amnibacterium sp. TaxID=1631851 RepID=UPI0035CBDD96
MALITASGVAAARDAVAALRADGARIALVPTLGALHEGHRALMTHAATVADAVAVSIFVNPLQFGPAEDFERYPRTPQADVAVLEQAGVRLLFAPSTQEMYPDGAAATRITGGDVASRFEGRTRPGHFDGVLTVVDKLLNVLTPDVVVFGRKDAQQAFLVRRMVADLNQPVRVDVVDTVREADGLALSSRNRFLSPADRVVAQALPEALAAAAAAAERGVAAALAAAHAVLDAQQGVGLDYLAMVDPATFRSVDDGYRGPALVLIAAQVGSTRLIDNEVIHLG